MNMKEALAAAIKAAAVKAIAAGTIKEGDLPEVLLEVPPFSASSGHRDQNSAHDEAPQGAVQLVQLGKQPSGQRRQAKG